MASIPTPSSTTVLVTGGSGFIGSYCILLLLKEGYIVHTTIRNLSKEAEARDYLKKAGCEGLERLTFFAADLSSDEGWAEVVEGCNYVIHVASPFPLETPKNDAELIIPARDGVLRVLKISKAAGVKRVVFTSALATVDSGIDHRDAPFTEEDWAILDGKISVGAYKKSKTIAERAAWDYANNEGKGLELTAVLPAAVFGPVLGKDFSTSIQIVKKLLDGSIPGCPRYSFGAVDVRDVATLHLLAMTNPAAAGQRFIGVNDGPNISFMDTANILRKNRPEQAKNCPTRELPNWLVKGVAIFDPSLRQLLPDLGHVKQFSNEKAKSVLDWKPRATEEGVLASADSLFEHKVL